MTHLEATVGYRMSPVQARRWAIASGATDAQRCRCTVRVRGTFAPDLWRDAIDTVVARHEILRTRFVAPPGLRTPLQVIGAASVLEAECRSEGRDHEIVLALPSLCGDRATMRILVRELAETYEALRSGGPDGGDPPIQFADLAEWQHDLLQSPDTASARDFWREQARTDGFELGSLGAQRDGGGARRARAIELHGVAATPGLFTAAWQLLTHRLNDRRRLLLFLLCDGRREEALAATLGPFARSVPLWSDLPLDEAPVHVLVERANRLVDEATTWQDYFDWDQVFGEIEHPPIVQLECVQRACPFECGGVEWRIEKEEIPGDAHGTCFAVVHDARHAGLSIEYDGDAIDDDAAAALLDSYAEVIRGMLRQPHQAALGLPLVGSQDRRRLMSFAASTPPQDADLDLVPATMARIARDTPDRVALIGGDAHVTYRYMDARASRVAATLGRDRNAGGYIGLAAGNSVEAIIGLLAIWRTGAAYVPVDPGQPSSRLVDVLRRCGVTAVLAGPETAAPFAEAGFDTRSLEDAADAPADREWPACSADRPAYAIFTSGSSGHPKAVTIPHGSLARSTAARRACYPHERSRYLLVPSLAFDSSVAVVFAALTSGGTLVVADDLQRIDPERLAATMIRCQISHVLALPSMYAAILAALPCRAHALTGAIVAGEECAAAVRDAHAAAVPGVPLYNEYGPTEATVWATVGAVDAGSRDAQVSIGRPRPGSRIYLLDAAGHLTPSGASGEIFIGGDSLALGYVAAPALTASRFVPDPYADMAGARMYRTGDRARWNADGTLQFLGRRDRQVKIRGYRIELGEIEAALDACPGVQRSAVITRNDGGGVKLTAYVQFADRTPPHGWSDRLRRWVRERLPAPMVPAELVAVDEMPLNGHGKLDRRRLAQHVLTPPAAEFVVPATATERVLAEIWREVLGCDRVSALDGFFDIGGHSLLATRVIGRVRQRCRADLPVRAIFRTPVLRDLARAIDDAASSRDQPIEHTTAQEAPLSPAQERFWFFEQLEPGTAAYHLGGALRLAEHLDLRAFDEAVRAIVARHGALRTVLSQRDGATLQQERPMPSVCWSLIDLSALPAAATRDAQAKAALDSAARHPFTLTGGTLMRLVLVRMTPAEHLLGITLHHIVADGWSVEVIMRELAAVYSAACAGRPRRLPDPGVRFLDYVHWLRRHAADPARQDDERYWLERLAGAEVLELPADGAARRFRSRAGARGPLHIDAAAIARLRESLHGDAVTLTPVLLAVFQALLHACTGQCDLIVGTPVSARTHPELELVVGPLLNTVLIRTRLRPEMTFGELVRQTAADVVGALTHQAMPFERVVERLRPSREDAPASLVRAWFVLDEAPAPASAFHGLIATGIELARDDVRHDLRLGLALGSEGLRGSFEYDRSLFEAHTIEQLARGYELIVAELQARPEARVHDLAIAVRDMRARRLDAEAAAAREAARQGLTRRGRVSVN